MKSTLTQSKVVTRMSRKLNPMGHRHGHSGSSPVSFDHMIVGNGILGLATAYRLSEACPDARICIIGKRARVGAASTAAGAMLGVFGEVTTETFANAEHRMYFDMSFQAGKLWPQFVSELNCLLSPNDQIEIGTTGTTILLNTKGTTMDDTPNFSVLLKALEEYGEPYEEQNGEDVEGLFPEEVSRPLRAVFLPNENFVDSTKVVNGLETALKMRQNVTFIDKSAQRILVNEASKKVKGVGLENGEEANSDTVIVAAGCGSQNLVDSVPCLKGRVPYVFSGSGVSFLVNQEVLGAKKIKSVIRTPNRAGACGLHLVPRGADCNHLYIGAGNIMDFCPRAGAPFESAAWIMSSVMKEFNRDIGRTGLVSMFSGSRPSPLDGYPLFGQSKSVPGLWFLSGTGRDGFHCSPLLSLYMVNQLLGDDVYRPDLTKNANTIFDTFTPERPPIETYSQAQSVIEAQKTMYALIHETGGALTTDFHEAFHQWIEKDVYWIYRELGISYGLPPLILMPVICRRWDLAGLKKALGVYCQGQAK